VDVVPASAHKLLAARRIGPRLVIAPEPRILFLEPVGFIAPVAVFQFEGNCPEEARVPLAHIASQKEGTNVLPDTVVKVGIPALGLIFDRLPTDKDVCLLYTSRCV